MTTPAATRSSRARRADRARPRGGTREALLAAGTRLFAERGFDGVSVATIAEQAGANKAMISYHFKGKLGLYEAILAAVFSEIVGEVERIARSTGPAPRVLRELIGAIGETATRRHPHFPTMMLREVLSGGRHLGPGVLDQPVRVLAAVQGVVERGVREGAFRPVDPLLTHLSVVGALVFFFASEPFRQRLLRERLRRPPTDGATYVRHLQDLILEGLAARPAGSSRARPS